MNNVWINGKQRDQVSIMDRGFSYGDGLFTTIKVINGQCELLTQHIHRLAQGIDKLSIINVNLVSLKDDLIEKAQLLSSGVLKVVITRGQGKRGYSSIGCDKPTVVIIAGNLPDYQIWQSKGISLGVSSVNLGINPLTAGIKHLNRLEQVLIKQQIDEKQWTDAIVLDCQGYLVETSMANLFWRVGNKIFTPSLAFSGVNGLMRQQVIEQLANMNLATSNIEMMEGRYKLNDLLTADEVFITNCLMGVVPVTNVENKAFHFGAVAKELQRLLNDEIES